MLVTAAVLGVLGMILHHIKRLDPYKGQILVLCALLWVALVFTVITFSFHEGMLPDTKPWVLMMIFSTKA